MKTRVLIIEDSYTSYYTSKQLLQSQLKLNLKVVTAADQQSALVNIGDFEPDLVMFHVEGGAVGLYEALRSRKFNRRNCEVTILLIPEQLYAFGRRVANFAATTKTSNQTAAAA